jgi:hypothetical protein
MKLLSLKEMACILGSALDDPENCGAPGVRCAPGSGFCEDGVCKDASSGPTDITY